MKKANFDRGVRFLMESFKEYPINASLYWEMLKDIDDKKWIEAIFEIVSTKTEIYPGTNLIAIIREKTSLDVLKYPLEGEAYREACEIAFQYNPSRDDGLDWNGTFKCSHPLIQEAIRLIGLEELANSDEGDPAIRAHFMQTYRSLVERDKKRKIIEPIKLLETIQKKQLE